VEIQYTKLIPMLSYPNVDTISAVKRMENHGSKSLKTYLDFIADTSLSDLQEKFTQTFDMSPTTSLDLGWHLYGEAYERGAFMLKIRELLRMQGIEETSELPDHLTHVLAAMDGLSNVDCADFVHKYVQPALIKIMDGFKDSNNPYQHAIQYMDDLLKENFGNIPGDV
jgi:nitrate reductase assembly molybdenum cofactor insertion protein NarJ